MDITVPSDISEVTVAETWRQHRKSSEGTQSLGGRQTSVQKS